MNEPDVKIGAFENEMIWCSSNELFDLRERVENLQKELDDIENTHMKLPVDSEGVPIHYGDMLEYVEYHTGDTKTGRVVNYSIRENEFNEVSWTINCGQWCNPETTHHAKLETLEDVLEDMILSENNNWGELSTMCNSDAMEEVISKYADKIREIVRGEESYITEGH